jgi:hypothetical protein
MGPPLLPGWTTASVWMYRASPTSLARSAATLPRLTVGWGTVSAATDRPTSTARPNG